MVEQEGRSSINPLANELQSKLNFEYSSNREWLVNDALVHVGGVGLYESLPTRARVSADGTRFEVGTRKVDLVGLLELAKILKPNAQGIEHITSFWQGNPKVKIREEDEWLFMGVDIKPTPRGLEEEYSSVLSAHDAALTAAIEGKTYDQMREDRWSRMLIEDVERSNEERGGHVILFTEPPRENTESGDTCEISPAVTVDTLREYPLSFIRHGLHNAPGTVKIEGRESRKFIYGSWIVIQPGRPNILDGSRMVQISVPETRTTSFEGKRPNDGLYIFLQIPEGEQVQTVDDIKKLKTAEVFSEADNPDGSHSRTTNVEVTMKDDSFKIATVDGSLELELTKPCCPECKKPTWKFPFREDVMINHDLDPKDRGENAHMYGYSAGGGEPPMFNPSFEREDGESVYYCGDCINTVVEKYKTQHPFASRTKAIEFTRQKLDELGYQDVSIWDSQVWRRRSQKSGATDGWEVYTRIEYERDGRKIRRYTGEPVLTDDGEFQPNMFPRKYVEFRYKTPD